MYADRIVHFGVPSPRKVLGSYSSIRCDVLEKKSIFILQFTLSDPLSESSNLSGRGKERETEGTGAATQGRIYP